MIWSDEGSQWKLLFRVVGIRSDGEETILCEKDFYDHAETYCWRAQFESICEMRIEKVWVKK